MKSESETQLIRASRVFNFGMVWFVCMYYSEVNLWKTPKDFGYWNLNVLIVESTHVLQNFRQFIYVAHLRIKLINSLLLTFNIVLDCFSFYLNFYMSNPVYNSQS